MVCISSWLLSLILLLIWSLSCFSFWKRPKAKTPFCLKIHQNLIKQHGRKTSLAIKSSKYSLHWPCKVCWCIELLRRSSAKSSSILFLLGMWLQSGPAFLHMETFFFPCQAYLFDRDLDALNLAYFHILTLVQKDSIVLRPPPTFVP